MVKIFNEEIVKILYDKYLRKSIKCQQQQQQYEKIGDFCDAASSDNNVSTNATKKDLQMELTQPREIVPSKEVQHWINPKPLRIRGSMSSPCIPINREMLSSESLKILEMFDEEPEEPNIEFDVHKMGSLLGPFVDEAITICLDRLIYIMKDLVKW